MKLRWLITKKHTTAEGVREYALKWQIPLMQAKAELEADSTHQRLQYYELYDKFGNGTWKEIPTEIEYT
jgi:hypothetical protein